MVNIYGIKNCDSVKKALHFFDAHAIEYELFDFKKTSPSLEKIQKWLENVTLKELFNTRSTTYRNLKLKELNLDENEKVLWLFKENLLIKRPVIEFTKSAENRIIVGFNEEKYKRIFT